MNFLSSLLTRNEIRLDVTKKSLLRLPFVTRISEVAQEFFDSVTRVLEVAQEFFDLKNS